MENADELYTRTRCTVLSANLSADISGHLSEATFNDIKNQGIKFDDAPKEIVSTLTDLSNPNNTAARVAKSLGLEEEFKGALQAYEGVVPFTGSDHTLIEELKTHIDDTMYNAACALKKDSDKAR